MAARKVRPATLCGDGVSASEILARSQESRKCRASSVSRSGLVGVVERGPSLVVAGFTAYAQAQALLDMKMSIRAREGEYYRPRYLARAPPTAFVADLFFSRAGHIPPAAIKETIRSGCRSSIMAIKHCDSRVAGAIALFRRREQAHTAPMLVEFHVQVQHLEHKAMLAFMPSTSIAAC